MLIIVALLRLVQPCEGRHSEAIRLLVFLCSRSTDTPTMMSHRMAVRLGLYLLVALQVSSELVQLASTLTSQR